MSDQQQTAGKGSTTKGPRLYHVAVHQTESVESASKPVFDEIVVFGTELEALRFLIWKPGWTYKTMSNGRLFSEAGS